jgi:very-short-patch-repair endonuclease
VVTVRHGRRVDEDRAEGIDLKRQALPASSIQRGMVTTRVQTVVDCARTLPFDEALCVVDSALREGCVTRDELIAAVEASPRTWRQRALRVVRAADARAANPFESCLRAIALEVRGLAVEPQLPVAGIGHADLGDIALRLLIEADSYEFHANEEAFRGDIRRYTAMVVAGWTVVRFCWEDVMFRQDYVRQVLADLVAAGAPARQRVRGQAG